MYIHNMDSYCYCKWDLGKATPINEEIKRKWKLRRKEYLLNSGRSKLFHKSFKKWQKGKVTPINDQILRRFKLMQFREYALKEYNISKNNRRYSIHHLIPKCYTRNTQFDVNNVIPLFKPIHRAVHDEYCNQELLIDPVMPVIDVLEEQVFCSK